MRYSVAWEPSRNDMLGKQEAEIQDLLAEGEAEAFFEGGPIGFCEVVESACPGQRTTICDRVAAETP